MWPFPSDK
nr:RecName: Full=Alpha-amylase 2; AltName: Full=1,4-alpha-D-glucan glucanohydrolase [Capsicum chinense]